MNRTRYNIEIFAAALVLGSAVASGTHAEDLYLETQVKLQTPKKDSKRSREGGLEHVPFRIWIPGGVETVRGVLFNPLYTKAVTQEHWQAVCRQWGFGIVAANYFGAKSAEFIPMLDTALATFAEQSKHPELKGAKMCLVGMSAGAGVCTRLAEYAPERTIAMGPVCLEVGPRDAGSMGIPTITVFGERDGKQYEKLMAKLPVVRGQSGRFAIAVQWRRRHEFGQANNLLVPLFDVAIRKRLGKVGEPLRPYEEDAGWLGDLSNWREGDPAIAPYADFKGDKSVACWLPDAKTAHAWRAFVARLPSLKFKSPPGFGDKQPLVIHKAGQPIEVVLGGSAKPKGAVAVFAGEKKLGELADGKLNVTFEKAGFYPLVMRAMSEDGGVLRSRPHTVIVSE